MKPSPIAFLPLLPLLACAAESYQRVPQPPPGVEVSSPDVVRIYVLRMQQLEGAIRAVTVRDEGREIGRIGRDEYLCWERPPGRTLAELEYEGPKIDPKTRGLIDLDCEAGHAYYYGITIDTAWNKPVVRLLTREEARELLRERSPAPVR